MVTKLSRREVLKLTGVAAGATMLTACTSKVVKQTVESTPVVDKTMENTPLVQKAVENTPTAKSTTASVVVTPVTATPNFVELIANPATPVTPEEIQKKAGWVKNRLFAAQPPFSFLFGGRPSGELLTSWPKRVATQPLDKDRTQYTFTWTDPQTALEVRCVAIEYADYPVVEWTVYFKNTNQAANTSILEQIQGLDTQLEREGDSEFVLHGCLGDSTLPKSYQPFAQEIGPNAVARFAPLAGRPTSGVFPYYNLQAAAGGWIVVVGWPGQWASQFQRDAGRGLRITAGQDVTRLYLKPGEEIRTPLIALLFWQGTDVPRAQNIWRRWFMAHNIPRYGGRPPAPIAHMQLPNEESGLWEKVKAYNEAGVKVDVCWRDAGWYPCKGDWFNTGTWEVDPKAFPNGFRPFSDWIHTQGKKLIVWFEPERVSPGTWLYEQHPEWLISPPGMPQSLLNLGNPEARAWLTDHVDKLLTEQGIDYYRQDFNMDPLYHWHSNDTDDRQGLTENLHVQGYLAYWDELRRRHPDMLIDSCASGGRRNDLETLRLAVPLLRSDYQFGRGTTLGNQGHTYGLSSWIPYYGTATYAIEPYHARSFYVPAFGVGIDVKPAEAKKAYDECRKVAPYMLGDYYPLTPYNLDLEQWIAWQFDQPEAGAGMVQAFRREKSAEAVQTFRLRGLDPAASYDVTNFDANSPAKITGQELLERGLTMEVKDLPGSALIIYKRV
ncbi:MAG: alpha-galactosidase [Chloroflexi bacterium]|nr:alpha-galactosidase [Chloroflexota bacterium]